MSPCRHSVVASERTCSTWRIGKDKETGLCLSIARANRRLRVVAVCSSVSTFSLVKSFCCCVGPPRTSLTLRRLPWRCHQIPSEFWPIKSPGGLKSLASIFKSYTGISVSRFQQLPPWGLRLPRAGTLPLYIICCAVAPVS